jgi:hypothetical protein
MDLQVLSLSDIVSEDEQNILIEAKKDTLIPHDTSTLDWSCQGNPKKSEWSLWNFYLVFLE